MRFRGKKIKLKDLLIFDGEYDPDKIKRENFLDGTGGMETKKEVLTVDFCNIVYHSDWYEPFWEKVKDTDYRWYNWPPRLDYFKNPESIKEASVDDIHKLLIVIIRMEHWNTGFVYKAARKGVIFAILNRIKEWEE